MRSSLQVIIPNVMGVVVYQPAVSKDGVSPQAEAFFRQLTRRYRVNLFDQLVFQNKDISVKDVARAKHAEAPEVTALRWFDLCFACNSGDLATVWLLLTW